MQAAIMADGLRTMRASTLAQWPRERWKRTAGVAGAALAAGVAVDRVSMI
jgi:hypothetical protein